jgi:hypothetical protein
VVFFTAVNTAVKARQNADDDVARLLGMTSTASSPGDSSATSTPQQCRGLRPPVENCRQVVHPRLDPASKLRGRPCMRSLFADRAVRCSTLGAVPSCPICRGRGCLSFAGVAASGAELPVRGAEPWSTAGM